LKLPFEARHGALQAAKSLEPGITAKIHDREHHDVSLKDLWSQLPESLHGKLALRGRNDAKVVEQLLLNCDVPRFQNGPAGGAGVAPSTNGIVANLVDFSPVRQA